MPLADLLDTLFLKSLLALYDAVFVKITSVVDSVGASLIVFGIVLNLALMPLYYRMEQAGKARAEARRAMDSEVARMRQNYKGRELYYYIQAIHRQFRFKPISVLFTSGALYMELAVFMTVYRYISSLWALEGTRFLAVPNLGQPDALLFGVNLLPLLMTLLNVGSALLYSPSRTARRMSLAVAVLFLVLLYDSPSGLVLYWASNNAFSLLRNLIDRRVVGRLPTRVKQRLSHLFHQE